MRKILIYILLILVAGSACNNISTDNKRANRSVLRKTIKNNICYNTLIFTNVSINVNLNGKQLPELRGFIKIRRDSAILISVVPFLGYEAARIILTDDSLKIINRLEKSYVSDKIDKEKLGITRNIRLKDIEDILIGNMTNRLRYIMKYNGMDKESYNFIIKNNSIKVSYLINSDYKIEGIYGNFENDSMRIVYDNFLSNDTIQKYPQRFSFDYAKSRMRIKLVLKLMNMRINKQFEINGNVGKNYKRITFEQLKNEMLK